MKSLTETQSTVYATLKDYGPLPDHVLVPIVQHLSGHHHSSSGIRTRRAELARRGLVKQEPKRTAVMPSGRTATFWKVAKR